MSRIHDALLKAAPQNQAHEDGEKLLQGADGEFHLRTELTYPDPLDQANGFGIPGPLETNNDKATDSDLPVPLRDELIKLIHRVFVFPNSHAPRTVVFSSVEGSRSTDICFCAAKVLAAQVAGPICLVNANFASSFQAFEKVNELHGLTEALISPSPVNDFAVPTTYRNLWLMPHGSRDVTHASVWPPDRLRSCMIELKKRFCYVLIDTPPVTSSPNAVLLGQMADGVVLVLEANSTRRETARITKDIFESAKINLLGAILNNQTFPVPEVLYRKL